MGDNSKIEWTDATWNPMSGCTKISAGCKNCYAEAMARRLKAMGQHRYRNGFKVTCHDDRVIEQPLRWSRPRMVFVCSMGDLFHQDVPDAFIRRVFDVMVEAKQHTFQVLTKRSDRLAALAPSLPWPRNVWAGVTIESDVYSDRVCDLALVPAAVRFLSLEPLLGPLPFLPVDLREVRINWVIVGGESGPRARWMDPEWARNIRDQCLAARVPFMFKQWGGVRKHENGCELDGREWKEMPRAIEVGQGELEL
jgi:protein gp37